jgi:hypothetical protein
MEKQIAKLVKLAQDYVEFGKASKLPLTHNQLRQEDKDIDIKKISIYLSDEYRTSSVYFGDVEVTLYSNSVRIPTGCNESYLDSVYKDAKKFFVKELESKIEPLLIQRQEEKKEELRRLEKKARILRKKIKTEEI